MSGYGIFPVYRYIQVLTNLNSTYELLQYVILNYMKNKQSQEVEMNIFF